MNERIKQLAEQAGIPVIEGHWDYNDREILVEDDGEWRKALPSEIIHTMFQSEQGLEKFAESIIKECIEKIETYRIPVGNSRSGELACEWTYGALKEIRDDIKQTFGVE